MALKRNRPFIAKALARQLKSGQFRSKTALGPGTVQAITEGTLEQDRLRETALSDTQARLEESRRASELANRTNRAQIASNEKIAADRLRLQKNEAAAARHDAEEDKGGFFSGLFGS